MKNNVTHRDFSCEISKHWPVGYFARFCLQNVSLLLSTNCFLSKFYFDELMCFSVDVSFIQRAFYWWNSAISFEWLNSSMTELGFHQGDVDFKSLFRRYFPQFYNWENVYLTKNVALQQYLAYLWNRLFIVFWQYGILVLSQSRKPIFDIWFFKRFF